MALLQLPSEWRNDTIPSELTKIVSLYCDCHLPEDGEKHIVESIVESAQLNVFLYIYTLHIILYSSLL